MDLKSVELDSDGRTLKVTFEASDDVMANSGPSPNGGNMSLLWYVLIWQNGKESYRLQVDLTGEHWTADVTDTQTYKIVDVDAPVVEGKTITAAYPLEHLPNLSAAFTWTAGTEWGEPNIYHDPCPDTDYANPPPDKRLPFPVP